MKQQVEYPRYTKRGAELELRRRGWTVKRDSYYPKPRSRGLPRTGLTLREACSFEALALNAPSSVT